MRKLQNNRKTNETEEKRESFENPLEMLVKRKEIKFGLKQKQNVPFL